MTNEQAVQTPAGAQTPPPATTVAVLMAVHAGANASHLDEALASMRSQTYARQRVFVYADGPLAASHEAVLAGRLRLASGQDVLLRGDAPAGLPTGLNRLIDAALQDVSVAYLARMDADDLSVPERIARQVDELTSKPQLAVVGSWVIEFQTPGVPSFEKRLPVEPAEAKHFMLYRSPMAHPSVMFRRSVFEQGHRYDERLRIMQDYDLWARLLGAGHKLGNVPEYLLWFRMDQGFYERRGGWHRAWGEVRMRMAYARHSGLLRPVHVLGLAALFTIRMLPAPLKRLAYQRLR